MRRGKEIHAILEQWALGSDFPCSAYGDRARSAIRYVPRGVEPEARFFWDSHGVRWKGTLDFLLVDGPVAIVGDYKTTSNAQWVKTPEQLDDDLQRLLYGDCIFTEYPQVEWILYLWIYMLPKPPARLVHIAEYGRERTPARIARDWAPQARELQKVLELGTGYSARDVNALVQARPHTCQHVGLGCDFAAQCNRSN